MVEFQIFHNPLSPTPVVSDEVRWILPVDDFYKININGAVFKQRNEAEIGVSVGFIFFAFVVSCRL